jgi:hypothetical protein
MFKTFVYLLSGHAPYYRMSEICADSGIANREGCTDLICFCPHVEEILFGRLHGGRSTVTY